VGPRRLADLAGVSQTSLNVFQGQVVILPKDLLRRPTSSQKFHDEFDCDASPLDDVLADENLRIHADSIMPVHCFAPLYHQVAPGDEHVAAAKPVISLKPKQFS